MQPDSAKYLWDALTAADLAASFVHGKTFKEYRGDSLLRSAMERQLQVIGEALSQLARRDSATAALVPDLGRIVAFRNMLVHAYATIDDKIVWGLVETRLPDLRETLRTLLENA